MRSTRFIQNDAGVKFFDRRMRVRLADEQEVAACLEHRLADRLAREQVVAEVDRLQRGILEAVRG
jgi:hypothetical protein